MVDRSMEADRDENHFFEAYEANSQRNVVLTQSPVRFGSPKSEPDWGKFIGATGNDESFVAGTPEKKSKRYFSVIKMCDYIFFRRSCRTSNIVMKVGTKRKIGNLYFRLG